MLGIPRKSESLYIKKAHINIGCIMKIIPNVIPEKAFTFLGCVFYGDPFHSAEEWSIENEIGQLWQRFRKLIYKYSILLDKIRVNPQVWYELHIETEEFKKTKLYYVFVGIEVSNFEESPLEMFVKILPTIQYLVYTTKVDNTNAIEYLFKEWIPENEYEQAYPYIIEAYDERRFKGMDNKKSEVDWYIPIKRI